MTLATGWAVGAVMGIVATWALLASKLEPTAAWLDSVLNLLPAALGGFAVAVVLAVPLIWWGLTHLFGTARGTLEQVVSHAVAAVRAASERDTIAAASDAERALHEAIAWYGPIAARRFMVQTALALLVTFGGLVGTGLLFRQTLLLGEQTLLLGKQNEKLDLQTVTAEAQRRGGLVAELFSILQKVSDMTPPSEALLQLPPGLEARVVAFSRAATRYWTAEIPEGTSDGKVPVPQFTKQPRSYERGQLLTGLILARVDVTALNLAGATFADADLRDARLHGAKLAKAELGNADLRGADLLGAELHDADLRRAKLDDAHLLEAELPGARLDGAHLNRARLGGAEMRNAQLREAQLRGAVLRWARLSHAQLHGADLRGADLFGADLSGAELDGADLDGAVVGSGSDFTPGRRPRGFPGGWSAEPKGWELFKGNDRVRLRRISAPPAAPSPSSR